MSVENLKEYARRCAVDPELRTAAKDIGMGNMDEHMRQAESIGLAWDRSDLVEFQKEMTGTEGDLEDISEEELDQVAGGVITTTAAVAVRSRGGTCGRRRGGRCGRSSGGRWSLSSREGWLVTPRLATPR